MVTASQSAFTDGSAARDISSLPVGGMPSIYELQDRVERLLERINMAVIYGGNKAEEGAVINQTANPRSWKSYQAVAEDIAGALRRLGCGNVVVIPEDMRLAERLQEHDVHMAWLNTGGVQGFSPMSHAAAMLEMLGVPYVGHDPLTAGILDRKDIFKRHLVAAGIPTAPFMTWNLGEGPCGPSMNDVFWQIFENYEGPFIVKPVTGRASLNVHWVGDQRGLADAVNRVQDATRNHVLIEPYLPGREYCVAVMGQITVYRRKLHRSRDPSVLCAIERLLDTDERIATSMDIRPITAERLRVLDQESDADKLKQLYQLARDVFKKMNLECLVRLDVRADDEGRLYILEANPKPDLKAPTKGSTSLMAASLSAYGMSYDDLILSLLANQVDLLFSQRPGTIEHLNELLK